MNSLLSYCGLVDRRKRASDKDLPVTKMSKLNSLSKNRKRKSNLKNLILISKSRMMSMISKLNWLMKSLRRYQSLSQNRFEQEKGHNRYGSRFNRVTKVVADHGSEFSG